MKSSRSSYIELIKVIESKLNDWKYYEIIRGKSIVTTVCLIFIKFLSDQKGLDIIAKLIDTINSELEDSNRIMQKFIYEELGGEAEDNVMVAYINGLDISKMPKEFVEVLTYIEHLDFTRDENTKDAVLALVTIFSSIYGERVFRMDVSQSDMNLELCAADLLNVEDSMDIYDFSCGAGTLLALAGTTGSTLYGQEENIEKATIAYALCKMAGANGVIIKVGDVLQNPMTKNYPNKKFDRIISAPPLMDRNIFIQKMYSTDSTKEFLYQDSIADSGSWIYVRHIIEKMEEEGKGVLVAPCSMLSREGNTKEDRMRIIERDSIETIVQLPTWVTATSTRLCIIVLRKGNQRHESKPVFMVDLSSVKGEKYFLIDGNNENRVMDSKKLSEFVKDQKSIEGISALVSYHEIAENDMNLTPTIYLRTFSEMLQQKEKTIDMLEQQKELTEQYHQTEIELKKAILNYYKLWNAKKEDK